MLFLAPRASRSAAAATADPKLRALLDERDALERQVAELRLRKDGMDPARYERELEALLTSLALKTKTIRELEAKK
jgi:chorismate mutase